MAISEETAGHRATLRVLAILDALAANQKGLTMAEICRELGAPKSSLFPILHTMADTEYIAYDEDTSLEAKLTEPAWASSARRPHSPRRWRSWRAVPAPPS